MIHVHNPEAVEWWAEGRPATRAEVAHSVDTGIPLLIDACQMGGEEAMADLARRKAWLETHYPAAEVPAGVAQA